MPFARAARAFAPRPPEATHESARPEASSADSLAPGLWPLNSQPDAARGAPHRRTLRPRALTRGDTILALVQDSTTRRRATSRSPWRPSRRRPSRLRSSRRPRREETPGTDGDTPKPAAAERKQRRTRTAQACCGRRGQRRAADARRRSERHRPPRPRRRLTAARRSGRATASARAVASAGGRPQRRAPLPQAKRELLISVDVGEQRVALLEDDRVAEVYLERPERRSIAGNIYLGTVDNVLPGMEAAFVEIGLEKNGFLYVDEIVVPELEGKRHGKKITDLIQRGQQILVQAVKDPMKTKGARLTTEISLPGRFLVYVPNGEGLGVSRRLEDAERQRLKDILKDIIPATGGVIVRTAAEGASAEDVERDLVFLQRLWKTIEARAKTGSAPELVYQEAELPLRIVRDLFAGDFVGRPRRLRPHPQADRRLPQEDLAAHGRPRPPDEGEGAAVRALRRREGDRVDARPPRRPPVGRLPRSSTTPRRSRSSTSTRAASSARARRRRPSGSRTRRRRTTSRR